MDGTALCFSFQEFISNWIEATGGMRDVSSML